MHIRSFIVVGLLSLTTLGCRDTDIPTSPPPQSPLTAAQPTGFRLASVTAGPGYTCGATRQGDAYCWGYEYYGELGNGPPLEEVDSPSPVTGGLRFTQLSAGENHTCGVTKGGQAYCWGQDNGSLGNGLPYAPANVPSLVVGGLTFSQVSAGSLHTCGVTKGGKAYCWGFGEYGQLGTDELENSASPLPVAGGLKVRQLSAGLVHTCAVTESGEVYCWGGQYRAGSIVEMRPSPVPVPGGLIFGQVSSGVDHSCGITRPGRAYCWGGNASGQLGTGTTGTFQPSPVPVAGGLTFTYVSAGAGYTCGVTKGGPAFCWGENSTGQLGNGAIGGTESSPVPVDGGLRFVQVSSGSSHTCAVTKGRQQVFCWGWDGLGQLGNGPGGNIVQPTPVPVSVVPLATR
jgi:alpha-tubulin suppressor-like RCC1 family protein